MKKLKYLLLTLFMFFLFSINSFAFQNGSFPPPFDTTYLKIMSDTFSYDYYIVIKSGPTYNCYVSDKPIQFFKNGNIVWLYNDSTIYARYIYPFGNVWGNVQGSNLSTFETQTTIYNIPLWANHIVYDSRGMSLNQINPIDFSDLTHEQTVNTSNNLLDAILNLPHNISVYIGKQFASSILTIINIYNYVAEIRDNLINGVIGKLASLALNIIEIRDNIITGVSAKLASLALTIIDIKDNITTGVIGKLAELGLSIVGFFTYMNPNSQINIFKDLIYNPDSTRLSNYVNNNLTVLFDKFGFFTDILYIITKIINEFNKISNSINPVLHIPLIKDPYFNYTLIQEQDFTFEFIRTGIGKTVHEIYLLIIDFSIALAIFNLGFKKVSNIMEVKV